MNPLTHPNSLQANRKKRNRIVIIAIVLLLVVAAVGIGLGVGLSKKGSGTTGGSGGSAGPGAPTPTGSTPSSSTSGKSGSLLTFEDGTKYTYQNDFGGDWAMDPKNPFGGGGKAQSWSPRVGSEEWQWGKDIVRGVNLGQVLRCPIHIYVHSWCVIQRMVRYSVSLFSTYTEQN
jgi:glucan 1,3-beta-glucosidase